MSTLAHHDFGLRTPHFDELSARGPGVGLVEVISENFMNRGGRPLAVLDRVRRDAEVVLHGVSLSIGGLDELSTDYLKALGRLVERVQPAWVSDHLCFGTVGGHAGHDLWPLPFTEESLRHVTERVLRVQDALGRRLVLENVSSYLEFAADELSEWEFIEALLERADCELLLDVNNLFINATNHGYDARRVLPRLPRHRVRQLHLAGHDDRGTHLFDTHGAPVADAVWALYHDVVRTLGPRPTIIEWDQNVPSLERLRAESLRAAELEAAAVTPRQAVA